MTRVEKKTNVRGIYDIDVKITILCTLANSGTTKDLVLFLLSEMDPTQKEAGNAEKIAASIITYRRGRKSQPARPYQGVNGRTLIAGVCAFMRSAGCDADDLEEVFVSGTAEEFAASFNGKLRETAFKIVYESSVAGVVPNELVPIDDHREKKPPTLRENFNSGFLAQRLIYVTPDAVENWMGVYNHPDYLQPTFCLEAHRAFLESSFLARHLAESRVSSIVSLGAGSHKKDVSVIKGFDHLLPKRVGQIDYTIVDYSNRMLVDTVWHVRESVETMSMNRAVKIHGTRCDFLELTRQAIHLRPFAPAIFFCFGGTIGNISEGNLLNHIRKISRPGDLLVIGMDTFVEDIETAEGRRAFRKRMREKYDNDHMRAFLRPALDALWPYLKGAGDIDAVQATLRPHTAFGDDSLHSDVPGSASAYWRVRWSDTRGDGSVVLLSSTRYNLDQFCAFAHKRRFTAVAKFDSRSNPLYSAVVLQYMGECEDDDEDEDCISTDLQPVLDE